jgi:hypothetical protein
MCNSPAHCHKENISGALRLSYKKMANLIRGIVRRYTALPKLPPQAAASFSDSQSKQISFNWTAEPGQKFLIQIALDAEFKRLYLSQESDQAELKIPRPTAGEYYIRVRATDADGYVGAFSATQKITIQSRWTTSDGEAINSGSGAIRSGF